MDLAVPLRSPRKSRGPNAKAHNNTRFNPALGPWYIINPATGQALERVFRGVVEWTNDPRLAKPYITKDSAFQARLRFSKLGLMTNAETIMSIHDLRALMAACVDYKPSTEREPELLQLDEPQVEMVKAIPLEAPIPPKPEEPEPRVQSEYEIQAFNDVIAALEEESTAYGMYLQAKGMLRSKKQKLRVIQEMARSRKD